MYFDHCETPEQLGKAISGVMKQITMAAGIEVRGPTTIPCFGPGEVQLFKQAFLEARSRAEIMRRENPEFPPVPDPHCAPIRLLPVMGEWCDAAAQMGQKMRGPASKTKNMDGVRSPMTRLEVVNVVERHVDFFQRKWVAFCEWVESCAEELRQARPVRLREKRDAIARELSGYHQEAQRAMRGHEFDRLENINACREEATRRLEKVDSAVDRLPRRLSAGEWAVWRVADGRCGGGVYSTPGLSLPDRHDRCAPCRVVNPVLWLFGWDNPRRPNPNSDEQLLIDCALLVVAHDETVREAERIYRRGTYQGTLFDCDRVIERMSRLLDEIERKGQLERAWKAVESHVRQDGKGQTSETKAVDRGNATQVDYAEAASQCEWLGQRIAEWRKQSCAKAPPDGQTWRDFRTSIISELSSGIGKVQQALDQDGQLEMVESLKNVYMEFEQAVRAKANRHPTEKQRDAAIELADELREVALYLRANAKVQPTQGDAGAMGENKPEGQAQRSRTQGTVVEERHVQADTSERIKLPEFSKPLSSARWGEVFQCCGKTIIRRIQAGALIAKKDGRRWRLRIDQLPAEYVQKAIGK